MTSRIPQQGCGRDRQDRDENTLTTALFTLEAALSHLAGAMRCSRVVLDPTLGLLLNLEVMSYGPIS